MPETSESARSRDPLIETAVRSLSDNVERQLAAAGFLENLKISDDGAEAAIGRWDALDAGKRRSFWRFSLWAALVVMVINRLTPLVARSSVGPIACFREPPYS